MKIGKVLGLAVFVVVGLTNVTRAESQLSGAGSTFIFPAMSKWSDEYSKLHSDVKINYQSIGSGGGIRQIIAKTVDFGATDGPMTDQMLTAVDGKILHIPVTLGAVVPTFNLDGITDLNFSGEVLADIFLGNIDKWDDPAIQKLNPNTKLPSASITVVHRADGSGTTYCWVDYLCKASKEWKQKVGLGTSVNWPIGLGGKGNEGVAGLVKQTKNSIGYNELTYALENNISFAAVKNKAGNFVKGSLDSVSAAAAETATTMPADYRVSITDATGEKSYPISTYSWLLVYQKNPDQKGTVIRDFANWILANGQEMMQDKGYAPLPENVRNIVEKTVTTIQ